jgi:hypothetical protein
MLTNAVCRDISRAVIKDLLPEMATDPKYRPELIRLLREAAIGI